MYAGWYILWCTTRHGLNSKKQIVSSVSLAVFLFSSCQETVHTVLTSLSYHMLSYEGTVVYDCFIPFVACGFWSWPNNCICGRCKPGKVRTIIVGKEQGELKGDLAASALISDMHATPLNRSRPEPVNIYVIVMHFSTLTAAIEWFVILWSI